jgi:RNA polymerase II subunit A small phosphatase-like protein
VFQPDNAVPIGTFIDNMDDRELMDILPVLLAVEKVDDVRQARPCLRRHCSW